MSKTFSQNTKLKAESQDYQEDPAENEDARSMARSLVFEVQMQTFEKDKAQVINGYLGHRCSLEDKETLRSYRIFRTSNTT